MDKLPGKDSQIVGEIKVHRKLPKIPVPKPKIILAGVIGLIIIGGAVFGVLYLQNRNQANKEAQTYQAMIKEVDNDIRNGNQGKAKDKLQKYLDEQKPKGRDHLYGIELRLSIIYRNAGDSKTARDWAEKAVQNSENPTYDTYLLIAQSSVKLNDKKKAIEYYQKCIDLLSKQETVNSAAQIDSLKGIIAYLKAEDSQ